MGRGATYMSSLFRPFQTRQTGAAGAEPVGLLCKLSDLFVRDLRASQFDSLMSQTVSENIPLPG